MTRRAKKYAKSDNKEESESVWYFMEPEAGRRPEICLSGAGSVGEPVVAVQLH